MSLYLREYVRPDKPKYSVYDVFQLHVLVEQLDLLPVKLLAQMLYQCRSESKERPCIEDEISGVVVESLLSYILVLLEEKSFTML